MILTSELWALTTLLNSISHDKDTFLFFISSLFFLNKIKLYSHANSVIYFAVSFVLLSML